MKYFSGTTVQGIRWCFSIALRQSIQWERILPSMIKMYLVICRYDYKYIKGDRWENPDVCKSMCTFLPRYKYLFLMCDIVIAGGEWTFHFSACLKEVTHTSIYFLGMFFAIYWYIFVTWHMYQWVWSILDLSNDCDPIFEPHDKLMVIRDNIIIIISN